MKYIISHCVFPSTCVPEEITAVPFLVPWYEEYDYSDRTSHWIFSHRRDVMWHLCCRCWLCFLSDLFPVAAKKKEEEEERARKEKAEKGVWLVVVVVVIEWLGSDHDWELYKRLLADSVIMMSAGTEGWYWNSLCLTCLHKHVEIFSVFYGRSSDFYSCCFLITLGSWAAEEAVGGGGRGEAEADICAC